MIHQLKQKASLLAPKILSPHLAYSLRYLHNRGHWPNLKHPKDLSEILISRILKGKMLKYAPLMDKIKVREYVKSKGLEDTLLKHFHYWDNAEDVSTDQLPDKFVLKTNNGSSGKEVFICRDKALFILDDVKRQLSKALKTHYDYEPQYNQIQPRIICEELIETSDGSLPTDYKFFCFHGKPVDCFVLSGRQGEEHPFVMSLDWKPKPSLKSKYRSEIPPPIKPQCLERMIEVASVLSQDFDFVRVDLYDYNGNVIFGELTFSPAGGIFSRHTTKALEEYGRIYYQTDT